MGFPARFVILIKAMHSDTTCRFIVNGEESQMVLVTTGIRHGRPLAPMLFVIVLTSFYDAADASLKLQGIYIGPSPQLALKVAGYADDTAFYVRGASECEEVMRLLTAFGNASGLRMNASKSILVGAAPAKAPTYGNAAMFGLKQCFLNMEVPGTWGCKWPSRGECRKMGRVCTRHCGTGLCWRRPRHTIS